MDELHEHSNPSRPLKQVTVLYFGAAGTATGIHSEVIALDSNLDLHSHLHQPSHHHLRPHPPSLSKTQSPALPHPHTQPRSDSPTAEGIGKTETETEAPPGEVEIGVSLKTLGEFLCRRHAKGDLGGVLKISKWAVNLEMVENEDVNAVILVGGEEVRG
jgi:hypothetical protein